MHDPKYHLLATPPENFYLDEAKVVRITSNLELQWGNIANCLHLKLSDSEGYGPGHGSVHCIQEHDLGNEGEPGDHNIQLQPGDNTSPWVKITHSEIHNQRDLSGNINVKATVASVVVWFYSGPDGGLKLKNSADVSDPHMNGFELRNL
jgi:hypothetical protein